MKTHENHPEILHFIHFRVFEAHSFLVALRKLLFILQHMDNRFLTHSLDVGIISFDNMVLTKNIKTSRVKFLVLVHHVA